MNNIKLYDITKKTVDRYDLIPNEEKIKQFKINEIKNESKIYKATTNNEKKLIETLKPIYLKDLNSREYDPFDDRYSIHTFKEYTSEEEKKHQFNLLNNYYDGKYDDKNAIEVIKNNKTYEDKLAKLYLLLTSFYKYNMNKQLYIMDEIILIPESLYLLQLLEQEKYEQLLDKDIKKQLRLYDISNEPVKRIEINSMIETFNEFGNNKAYEEIINKIYTKQKILQKIK